MPSNRDQQLYALIKAFADDTRRMSLLFPASMTGSERRLGHEIAQGLGLQHTTVLEKKQRVLKLFKISAEEMASRNKKIEQFQKLMADHKEDLMRESCEGSTPNPDLVKRLITAWRASPSAHVTPAKAHSQFRYFDWNIEWMDDLFVSDDRFASSANGVPDVPELCQRIAGVILTADPDLIAIQEGPASCARLDMYQRFYLRDQYTVLGGLDGDRQRLYFLVRKNGPLCDAQIFKPGQEFLSQPWLFDVNGDLSLQSYRFTRTPLVISATLELDGEVFPLYAVCIHTKSKYVNGGEQLWRSADPDVKQQFVATSVKNRRRLAAECGRVRKMMDRLIFKDDPVTPLVVISGDFNDSIGNDYFEEFYLLFDSVSALLGSPFSSERLLHPLLTKSKFMDTQKQFTAIFDDFVDGVKNKPCLLDHIFVSDPLLPRIKTAMILHELFERYSSGSGRSRRPSDHRPVMFDISF
ncbi:MAG: hypothetical protein Q8P67_26355 [archaeon]|nr:hypothetical protein [archaeon]